MMYRTLSDAEIASLAMVSIDNMPQPLAAECAYRLARTCGFFKPPTMQRGQRARAQDECDKGNGERLGMLFI